MGCQQIAIDNTAAFFLSILVRGFKTTEFPLSSLETSSGKFSNEISTLNIVLHAENYTVCGTTALPSYSALEFSYFFFKYLFFSIISNFK